MILQQNEQLNSGVAILGGRFIEDETSVQAPSKGRQSSALGTLPRFIQGSFQRLTGATCIKAASEDLDWHVLFLIGPSNAAVSYYTVEPNVVSVLQGDYTSSSRVHINRCAWMLAAWECDRSGERGVERSPELGSLLEPMRTGRPIQRSDALKELARKAAAQRSRLMDETLEEWAERLAEDISGITD
jgi:hypothetical protein